MSTESTHMNVTFRIPLVLLAALAASNAANICFATTTTSTVNQATQARMESDAEQLALQSNFAEASKRYETLASQASKADHDHLALKAAWYAAQARDIGRTQSLLDSTNKILVGSDAALRTTVAAALTLLSNQPDSAINMLDQIPLPLPDDVAPDVLAVRSQALFSSGRIVLALNAALDRERVLKSTAAINQNHQMIWNSLKQAASSGRDMTTPSSVSRTVAGWMDLARAYNNNQRDPFAFNRAMNDWRARYAGHPGMEFIVMNTIGITPALPKTNTGDHLALLLPLSGKQQASGVAVRDGFLAALLRQDVNTRPVVQIYDTALEGAVDAYKHAISDGANMVVGPLLKEDVQAVAASEVSIPTLALNNAGDAFVAPAQLYQFSLDPEDEARQVAMRARAEGKNRAIVLVPN
ncbi:MAG: penicillin-binding protein activator, partial [Steroidobacter sp.]